MSVQIIDKQPGGTDAVFTVGSSATLSGTIATVSAVFGRLSTTERQLDSYELQQQFMVLVSRWRDQTGMWSSFTRKAAHPDYLRIIAMGRQVVPLILRELRDRGGQWYYALEAITEDNPVPPDASGQIPQMKAAWLEWGRSRGFI